MSINVLKQEIKNLLDTLAEQNRIIDQYSGKIPQIELDIIMSNIRRLYDVLYEINKKNDKEFTETNKTMTEPVVGMQTLKQTEVVIESKPEEETKSEIKKEEEAEETKMPLKSIKKDKGLSLDLFAGREKETLADKFKDQNTSVHEKMATENSEKTLAEKMGKQGIENLRAAIGINDKFLFINQLFKGDLQEYNKAIDKLNSYENITGASVFLEELLEKFKWDKNDENYRKLEDLLIRKFIK